MNRSLLGDSEDGCRNEDVSNSSPGGDTAKPALVAGFRDDNVGPGHLKPAERDACEDRDEGADDRVPDDVRAEEANDGAVEKLVDDGDVDAADTGEWAGLGADVLDSRTHFGGDGRLLDEEEVGFDNLGLIGFLVLGKERGIGLIEISVFSFERCGSGSFDHSEGGYEIAVSVGNLA